MRVRARSARCSRIGLFEAKIKLIQSELVVQRGKNDEVERLEKQVEYYTEVLAQTEAILTKLLLLAAADVHRREFNEYTDLAGKPILEIGINLAKLKLILL